MKKTMTTHEISHELMQDSNANWSLYAAYALAEYYEQLEEDLGETLEFDAVAIRCEFSEYSSLENWADEYFGGDAQTVANALGLDVDMSGVEFEQDEEEVSQAIQDYIESLGLVLLDFNGGILVSN